MFQQDLCIEGADVFQAAVHLCLEHVGGLVAHRIHQGGDALLVEPLGLGVLLNQQLHLANKVKQEGASQLIVQGRVEEPGIVMRMLMMVYRLEERRERKGGREMDRQTEPFLLLFVYLLQEALLWLSRELFNNYRFEILDFVRVILRWSTSVMESG